MIAAFEGIVGQERAIALLERALARPSHAYLFVGPAAVGKFTCAKAWVKALFCADRSGCGTCTDCQTLAHGNHPDFHVWQPAGKQNTTIDQVREIRRQAELAPYRAAYQVHVLWADTLRAEAANCLLKTLEEPPTGTVLVLLAQSVADLLATMVSRCQRIGFSVAPPGAIAAWLQDERGVEPARARAAAHRSGGRPGRAHKLATEPDPPATDLLSATDLAEALAEGDRLASLPSEQQIEVLEDLIDQIRDARIWLQTGRRDWLGRPDNALRLASSGRSPTLWATTMERLEATRGQLSASANARLAWTALAGDLVGLQARHAASRGAR